MPDDTIEIENINTPGRTSRVGREKFEAMKTALLHSLTSEPPGMSAAEMKAALLPHLPQALFPNGEKAGWWMKSVQLDQEAKGIIKRSNTKPLRFYRVS
ncbi:MAG: hypothetical protein AAGO57_01200 [Pseudomonadota bacterium]